MTHPKDMDRKQLVEFCIEHKLVKNKMATRTLNMEALRQLIWKDAEQRANAIIAEGREKSESTYGKSGNDFDRANNEVPVMQPDEEMPEPKGYVVKRSEQPEAAPIVSQDELPAVLRTDVEPEPRRFAHAAKSSGEEYAAKLRRRARNRAKHKMRLSRRQHNPTAMQAGW